MTTTYAIQLTRAEAERIAVWAEDEIHENGVAERAGEPIPYPETDELLAKLHATREQATP